ncbi:hypothetical protein [Priestia megaterium]|uniref:hypothetical protein n=1 Tax=Priestia megaterium TaxID=1404 RepID=UPI00112EEEE6|nr:hypothetical protein [Priestia megaterium]TPF18110.1 hypothetical protein CBE78_02450 [Priestia megaterium]TPF22217.1 hypothetical protein CBE79_04955 [Priestia megaterium]
MTKILPIKGLEKEYIELKKVGRKHNFYNEELNNLIVINPVDKEDTIVDVVNATVNGYDELIKILNTESNLVIEWYKVVGTTSDYAIYEDFKAEDLKFLTPSKIIKQLENHLTEPLKYKFAKVKDGKVYKLN